MNARTDDIYLVDAPTQRFLAVALAGESPPPAIQAALSGVLAVALGQGLEPGHAFVKTGLEDRSLEVGVFVARDGTSLGEVRPGALPAGAMLRTVHEGPHSTLGEAYRRLIDFAKREGRQPRGYTVEILSTDPADEPNPTRWRTRVYLPLT